MFDSCICIDVDCEEADLFTEQIVTARSRYKCCECGVTINPGDQHECANGKWHGDFDTFRTCLACMNVRDSLMECGWYYGQLWETIHNSICISQSESDDEYCICPGRNSAAGPKPN